MSTKNTDRRKFLQTTASLTIGAAILPRISFAHSLELPSLGFTQSPLPYPYQALEPMIDALTMDIHYNKHAAAYTKNLADACVAEKVNTQQTSIEKVLANISSYSTKMRNHAGGHFNHELFWKCMQAQSPNAPNLALTHLINRDFGSFESFKNQFAEIAKNRFGSGWAWLVQKPDNRLAIGSTPNQDNPLMDISELKGNPLLGLDLWEHAYYLKYQNKRADYINNWFHLINWDFVASRTQLS